MDVIEHKDELHEIIEDWLHHSDHVALVPTMESPRKNRHRFECTELDHPNVG